jgi:Ca2+-binding RTX toxin-like protein
VLRVTAAGVESGSGSASFDAGNVIYDPGAAYNHLAVDETALVVIGYTVSDGHGGSASSTLTITVTGVNDRPDAAVAANWVEIDEGQTATNSGSFFDADTSDSLTIVASIGSILQATGNQGGWLWSWDASDGPGQSQTVFLTASDGHGGVRQFAFDLLVKNANPTAVITGAPANSNEGTEIALGVLASDPAGAADPLSFAWTVTKDDRPYADGAGAELRFTPNDNGLYRVRVVASDGDGGSAADERTILVNNVAPTMTPLTGPSNGVRGQARSFAFAAADAGPADDAAGFEYRVEWGDGSALQTAPRAAGNGAGVSLTHIFQASGVYTVRVTPVDQNGLAGVAATRTIEISPWALQDDPLDPGRLVLVIGGSIGNDRMQLSSSHGGDYVKLKLNELDYDVRLKQTFGPNVGRIVVHAQAGDDDVQSGPNIGVPVALYGDSGQDHLRNGDFMDGGEGHDKIDQGAGRSTIYGGLGDDEIHAGANGDWIDAGPGDDKLYGGSGHDTLFAGDGDDEVYGGSGDDWIEGGEGHDRIDAGSGHDRVMAGDGDDFVDGGSDDDWIDLGAGNDTARAGSGQDLVRGGEGRDSLDGESGDDILLGGDGDDLLQGGGGRDVLWGGYGGDRVVGEGDDDILVAGRSAYDAYGAAQDAALKAILAEWTSGRSYAVRVANLRGAGSGPRANGAYFLNASTVFNDSAADVLTGSGGQDWFWLTTDEDQMTDKNSYESVN